MFTIRRTFDTIIVDNIRHWGAIQTNLATQAQKGKGENDMPEKFLLMMDLQLFADDVDDEGEQVEELSGEEEVMRAIQALNSEIDSDEDSEYEDESDDDEEDSDDEDWIYDDEDNGESDEDEEDDDDSEYEEEDEEEEEDEDTARGRRREQSREDNARFAAERRQRELDERVQAELERRLQDSPEMRLAKEMSDQFGTPINELLEQFQEERLKREAETQKVPVERLRREREQEQRTQKLEEELNTLRFQNWKNTLSAEGDRLLTDYPMLDQKDMDAAENYILYTAKNVNIPLEEAVYAVHGRKIIEALAAAKIQDNLANESGRKRKTPLPPNNGNSSPKQSLSAEERYVAKQMGMSEDDYLKYKI